MRVGIHRDWSWSANQRPLRRSASRRNQGDAHKEPVRRDALQIGDLEVNPRPIGFDLKFFGRVLLRVERKTNETKREYNER